MQKFEALQIFIFGLQAAHLLQAPKATADDITNISSTCFKLNSLQLRALLTQYIPDAGEPPVSPGFVERVVVIAENMADELTRTDGREVGHVEFYQISVKIVTFLVVAL